MQPEPASFIFTDTPVSVVERLVPARTQLVAFVEVSRDTLIIARASSKAARGAAKLRAQFPLQV